MRNFLSRARRDPAGYQVVDVVVDHGYQPDAIQAAAGVPIRLVFHREDDDPCSERVVFSSPRIDRRLAATGTTTVELPGQPPGEIRFTCGMGRYRGRIQVIDGHGPSMTALLRRRASRRASRVESPLGTALVLWTFTLPLVALLAVLAFDSPAALAAAAAALVAWIAGCMWALRLSARSA